MKTIVKLVLVGWMSSGMVTALGASSATEPTTTPTGDATSGYAQRYTFLGNQLSTDEAAIAAINKALVQNGYQSLVASDKVDAAAKGNERMNRNGGGPKPWKEFYGQTARDFILHDSYHGPLYGYDVHYQIPRPQQFDYIYQANNQQTDAAKAEVEALGKKVDALVARRKELESEQSALWATIAFESIENRDIALRPLYRDKLQADPKKFDDNQPEPANVKALRAAVLYLREIEHATSLLTEDKLESQQEQCYLALREVSEKSLAALQEAAANFSDSSGVDPGQIKQVMGVVESAKQIQSHCRDAAEAYHKAQEAEAAKEEGRKQLYRGTLQHRFLFDFTAAVGALDDSLQQLSVSWDVKPVHGVKSADKVSEITITPSATATSAPAKEKAEVAIPINQTDVAANGQLTGSLFVLFRGDLAVYVNGKKIHESPRGYPTIRKIPVKLNQGDWIAFRVNSIVAYPLRFAFVSDTKIGSFVSSTSAVRKVAADPNEPIPQVSFSGDHAEVAPPEITRGIWDNAKLPSEAVPLVLPDRSVTYDFGLSVPKPTSGELRSIPNERSDATEMPGISSQSLPDTKTNVANEKNYRRLDLLKLVNTDKDCPRGTWSLGDGVLNCSSRRGAHIEFPYIPPAEYDYRIQFKRLSGDQAIEPICAFQGHQFSFCLGGWTNSISEFRSINGNSKVNDTAVKKTGWIVDNKSHELIITVRENSLEAIIDGKSITKCKPNYTTMDLLPFMAQRNKDSIGLYLFGACKICIEAAEIIEISGEGKHLR
jgi:hypothetical protein